MSGMSAVGLAAGIGTEDGRVQGKCKDGKTVGEESGELVGCIISVREDFIGEV